MGTAKPNILTTVNLNGTELVIADENSRASCDDIYDKIADLTTRVTNLETAIAQVKN